MRIRIWVDLANSPHVLLFEPIVRRLREEGHEVLLTARDHAQTIELARRRWPDVEVVGAPSPAARLGKVRTLAARAKALRGFARRVRPDVAFSHGSYAQLVAARLAGIPAVTMMDYEYQPANHLSFRIARRVVVPAVFPDEALRRFGAHPEKVLRYQGFKEELYLAGFRPDLAVLDQLGLDPERVIAVFRPPPDGALYHRTANTRFDELLRLAVRADEVQPVLLPRSPEHRARYEATMGLRVPKRAIDGLSLLALADLTIGAGGTMNRESALLGTLTYTVFSGPLAAVDADLIRKGQLKDLRASQAPPRFVKKSTRPAVLDDVRQSEVFATVRQALAEVTVAGHREPVRRRGRLLDRG